jgi:hypothetical protein
MNLPGPELLILLLRDRLSESTRFTAPKDMGDAIYEIFEMYPDLEVSDLREQFLSLVDEPNSVPAVPAKRTNEEIGGCSCGAKFFSIEEAQEHDDQCPPPDPMDMPTRRAELEAGATKVRTQAEQDAVDLSGITAAMLRDGEAILPLRAMTFENWLKAPVSHYEGGDSTICYARAAWNAALETSRTIEHLVRAMRVLGPELGQMLNAWKDTSPSGEWGEYDESVRMRLIEWMAAAERLGGSNATSQPK